MMRECCRYYNYDCPEFEDDNIEIVRVIRRYKGELHNSYHHIHKLYDCE